MFLFTSCNQSAFTTIFKSMTQFAQISKCETNMRRYQFNCYNVFVDDCLINQFENFETFKKDFTILGKKDTKDSVSKSHFVYIPAKIQLFGKRNFIYNGK